MLAVYDPVSGTKKLLPLSQFLGQYLATLLGQLIVPSLLLGNLLP